MSRDLKTHKRYYDMLKLLTTGVLALLSLKGFGEGTVMETWKERCIYGIERSSDLKGPPCWEEPGECILWWTILTSCSVLLGLHIGKTQLQAREQGSLFDVVNIGQPPRPLAEWRGCREDLESQQKILRIPDVLLILST